MVAGVELPIDQTATAEEMANTIFGDSVEVLTATYTGDPNSSGIYTDGIATSPGVVPGDEGVLFSTGNLSGFTNDNATQSNLNTGTSTASSGPNNVAEFNAAAGANTFDASFLDVSFIPDGNQMTMQLVFASEEYPEFTNSAFQDFVGVWVNDEFVNIALGDGDVDPGNLNSGENGNLFQDNTADQLNTEMDGVTVTLTLVMNVNAGDTNTIRIGIADVADSAYDSTLLIAANSVQTDLIANDDDLTMAPDATKTFDVLGNDTNTTGGTLFITHINGQEINGTTPITLPSGQDIIVNSDGTITVVSDSDEETVNFTYQVESTTGEVATAFVSLLSVPCFVAETMILTDKGERPVEDLSVGDMVITKDRGAQPIRWIGGRQLEATGDLAPILVKAGTFGAHADLAISPLHRILIKDVLAELLFGEPEVLVAAKDLVNGHTVKQIQGGLVDYFHLLFDQHEVIYSAGLETESFLPGPHILHSFEADIVAEIREIFPELELETGAGYSASARPTLKHFEAQLLSQKWAA
ncbi:MAG: Hint domain-containing protein [Pseudomonadota bacterium]